MFELQDSDDPSRLALNNHSTTSSLRLKGRGGTLADSDSNLALGKHRSRGYPIDSDVFATTPLHDANHCFQEALDRDWRKQKASEDSDAAHWQFPVSSISAQFSIEL